MAIKKVASGWQLDMRLGGRAGKRRRKTFKFKTDAIAYQQQLAAQFTRGEIDLSRDNRRLSELINLWYSLHGVNLKDGFRLKTNLINLAKAIGDPIAKKLKPIDFLAYRQSRQQEGIAEKTLNNELGYLRSVYNKLYRLEVITYTCPIEKIDKFKIDERELTFLTLDQIDELRETIHRHTDNPHLGLIVDLCLATGARWSEAEGMTLQRINHGKVTFVKTKNGKTRSIPINDTLATQLTDHLKIHGQFSTSTLSAFRRAMNRTSIVLPKGQNAHVLRHTFASYFIMRGGNVLTLQRILDHSDIKTTMRYAHLAPEHLQDATRLNPLQRNTLLISYGDNAQY